MTETVRAGRWQLSAPESSVLLAGPGSRDGDVLKLAFMELVVRKTLRLVTVKERRLYFWSKRTNVLTVERHVASPPSRSLRAVIDTHPQLRSYPDGTFGASTESWARTVFERYRKYGGYVQAEVLPVLEERGFFVRVQSNRLGMFASTQWMITAAGEAALEELSGLLETGRALFGSNAPGFGSARQKPDPAAVQAYVDAAGAAILLLRGHYPQIRRQLGRVADRSNQERRFDGPIVISVGGAQSFEDEDRDDTPLSSEPSDSNEAALDIDALAHNLGPGPLDGIDAAYDAIDADVDSGGGGDGDGGE